MMIWFIAVVLIFVALFFMLPPLLRQAGSADADRSEQNILIAKEQLAVLEKDLASGGVDQAAYDIAKDELEQSLATNLEVSADSEVAVSDSGKGRIGVLVVALFVPLFSLGLYAMLGSPKMADPSNAPKIPVSTGDRMADLEARLVDVRKRLDAEPGDIKGWLVLGRSYMALERYPEAVEAYSKANELSPEDPNVMLPLADSLAMANKGRMEGEASKIIDRVLELEPDNQMALWLAGMGARQSGDKESALVSWERLYKLLPPGSEDQVEVGRLIAGLGGAVASSAPAAASASQESAVKGVVVTVDLPENIRSQVKPEDTVFIYAKAMQGPPMPLAAAKKQVKDLPLTITLDDSMAMMPQMKISGFAELKVGARVSKGGAPVAQPGDLFAEQANVTAGSEVSLMIDQVVP